VLVGRDDDLRAVVERHALGAALRFLRLPGTLRVLPGDLGLDHGEQLGHVAAGHGQPVGDVSLRRQVRQGHKVTGGGDALQRPGHRLGVPDASVVVIRQDDDVSAAQVLGELRPPLAGAHRVAGGRQAVGTQRAHVLLPFHHEDDAGGMEQLGQAVRHAADAVEAIDPTPLPVRAALAEVLRVVAHDLEQQCPLLVAVVVGLDDFPEAHDVWPFSGPE
jgi:hypothetical protein